MRTAAVNIPHSLTRVQAERDSSLAFTLAGVVLACEVDRSNDGPFEDAAHRAGCRVWFRGRKTQVAFPAEWTEVIRLKRTLTEALTGVNPSRDLNGVMDADRRTIYWAAHMTNGKNNPAKSNQSWRRIMWSRYERRAAKKVAKWHARGWNQVIGGDLNDLHGAQFHPTQVTAIRSGLMHLIAVPAAGYTVVVTGKTKRTDNEGDHPQIAADITFKES